MEHLEAFPQSLSYCYKGKFPSPCSSEALRIWLVRFFCHATFIHVSCIPVLEHRFPQHRRFEGPEDQICKGIYTSDLEPKQL